MIWLVVWLVAILRWREVLVLVAVDRGQEVWVDPVRGEGYREEEEEEEEGVVEEVVEEVARVDQTMRAAAKRILRRESRIPQGNRLKIWNRKS